MFLNWWKVEVSKPNLKTFGENTGEYLLRVRRKGFPKQNKQVHTLKEINDKFDSIKIEDTY